MSDIVKQSTIGAKLRKLFSNNKQTVAENIPEEKEFPVPAAPIGSDPSADSGKVPTVQDDGSYALATPSGGSNIFRVTVSGSDSSDKDITADKSYEEILSAYTNGSLVFAVQNDEYILYLSYKSITGNLKFVGYNPIPGSGGFYLLTIDTKGCWTEQ